MSLFGMMHVWTPFDPLREVVAGPMSCSENERKVGSIINQGQCDLENLTLTLPPIYLTGS